MNEAVRYVALGDSFTEGVGDEQPDGSVRGWADMVAAGLARHAGAPIDYANLSIRGRLLKAIVDEQLPAALALDPAPTIMTFNGGGNDILRPGYHPDQMVDLTRRVMTATAERGIRLVLLSGPDPSQRLPTGKRMRHLSAELTQRIADEAATFDHITFVDNFHDLVTREDSYWSPDRLHLNAAGHRRVAARVLTALGVPTEAPVVDAPALRRTVGVEARYFGRYVVPWIGRRLRRRSSGDGRSAKFATWTVVDPAPAPFD